MKSTLHLNSLHLKLRGLPAATAAGAVRELGPALARELADGAKSAAAGPLAVSRNVSTESLRSAIATRVAGALQSHLGPQR